MDAIEFVEIMDTIKACGQKIKFLSANFIQCCPTRDSKTGRMFSFCYSLEAGRWEGFISLVKEKLSITRPAERTGEQQ